MINNNTVWGVGWGTPGAALGHTRGSSGAPPTHRGLFGGCSAPQQPPNTPLQSVNIPPQLQQCLGGGVLWDVLICCMSRYPLVYRQGLQPYRHLSPQVGIR